MLLCVRRGRLAKLEMQRDGGYRSAILRIISAGETDLTQMKRVTKKGYGNKTRKTDGKKQSTNYNKPTQTPHTTLLKYVVRKRHKMHKICFFLETA